MSFLFRVFLFLNGVGVATVHVLYLVVILCRSEFVCIHLLGVWVALHYLPLSSSIMGQILFPPLLSGNLGLHFY